MSSSSRRKPKLNLNKVCSVPGCKTKTHTSLCEKHRARQRRTGMTGIRSSVPVDRRERKKIENFRTPRAATSPAAVHAVLPTLTLQVAEVFQPLLAPRRYKGAKGGRGSGKSHFFAEQAIIRCLSNPTTRVVCIREVQASLALSVKLLLEDKIRSLRVHNRFRILKTHIEVLDRRGNARGVIIFMGMQKHTADSIKSLEKFDIAWIEEAQSLSKHSWSILRPTIRKEGSEIWCSWNPRAPNDPVEEFFHDMDAADGTCVHANYNHNPWFPEVLQKEMLYDKRRDFERYLHVWEGKYQKHSSARVFKNWAVGAPEDFETLRVSKLMPRYGADWGFSRDPTVGIRVKIDDENRKLYVDREVHEIGCEIDRSPALFNKLDDGQVRKYPLIADSARPETISYMRRNGFPLIKPARKGTGSVEEGVEFIKAYDVVIHPACTHTIDEFTHYSYKVDEKTEEVTNVLDDRKNHVIDAVRYAVETARIKARAGKLF